MLRRKRCGSLLVFLLAIGCRPPATGTEPPPKAASSLAVSRELSENGFGPAVVELLRSDRRGGKQSQLATAIVRRQLERARRYFDSAERDAGLAAVRGALLLIRAGELQQPMWQGYSRVLVEAAEEAARLGQEGEARALYSLVKQSGPSASLVAATNEHLAAMDQFAARPGTERVLERLGDEQRVAVERSLYEPSTQNLDEASRRIADWINAALVSDVLDRWGEEAFDRQEAIEAYRARRFGALTMVATHLRHGSPAGALDWLEKEDLARLAPSELRNRLEQAAEDDDLSAWGALYQFFQAEADPSRAESSIGGGLAEAAALGAATEMYRSEPRQLLTVGPLALLLPDYQMGEVVPELIQEALGAQPGREELSWALSLLMRAILVHGEAGDLPSVRRILAKAEPCLSYAERQVKNKMLLRPNPARIFRSVATFEARATDLDRARADLERSLAIEPSAIGYVDLGRIEHQRGDLASALVQLDKAQASAKSAGDVLGGAEALTTRYEWLSDSGDSSGAEQALRDALRMAMGARDKAQRSIEQAQAERRFARVLEHYGKYDGAARASTRALEASRSDRAQLSATILDAGRRAFVLDDIRALRQTLRDAMDDGLSGEDCLYVALWLRILERRHQRPTDGTVEDCLTKLGELAYWPGRLSAWMQGLLTMAELEVAARKETERVEVKFYRAMSSGQGALGAESLASLAAVANSRAVGLIEISMAQDLRRRAEGRKAPNWPDGVTIP